MKDNLDFLNQINQMYSYLQLPIKLSDNRFTHGDLYVYSNGKKLTGNESSVSALLHLDMDNLGPLDIHVSLRTDTPDKRVTTNFYVQDDSILDFLENNMELLNKRLESRGYNMSYKMHVSGDDKDADENVPKGDFSGVNFYLGDNRGLRLSEYSFDVRG